MSFTAVTAMEIGSMISMTITLKDMACTVARVQSGNRKNP